MAEVTDWFGGEERSFRVAWGELKKIQLACDKGPPDIAFSLHRCVAILQNDRARVAAAKEQGLDAQPMGLMDLVGLGLGDWRVEYVREPIYHGLVGGGMSPNEAGKLIRAHLEERGFLGLVENAELAFSLLVAGASAPPGEPSAGEPKPEETPPASTTSAQSTEPPAP